MINQPVDVYKETNIIPEAYDPYCCKITITRVDRTVTVGYIPRELSRYVFYFLHEGGAVVGSVASTNYRPSQITEGEVEVPIYLPFTHISGVVIDKLKEFIVFQTGRMGETFAFDDDDDEMDEEDTAVEDDEDEETEECENIVPEPEIIDVID